jgi:hypothetical protein
LDVLCVFDDPALEALLEFLPEDRPDDAMHRTLIRLTPASPKARWTWLALSPFRSGYRWRWAGSAAWSDRLSPEALLTVRTSGRSGTEKEETAMFEEIEIEGVRLLPVKGKPSTWTYQPTRAGIAQTEGARKQFTLIESGPVAMLAMTAMWGVVSQTLERVRQALAEKIRTPAERITLSHVPVDVREVQLLIGDGTGGFTPLASSASSGAPPYNAAFNLRLDAGQLEKVKKAMQHARGWLAVRYVVIETAPASHTISENTTGTTSATNNTTWTSGGASSSESFTTEGRTSSESRESNAPRVMEFQSDAADWGLNE